MEITHDVILDLLPLYLADEVSTDTRALIEHYLATDPQLAQLAEQAAAANLYQDVPIPINTEAEMQTFKKVKRLMFQHNLFLGLAIAFTFLFAMSIPFLWDDAGDSSQGRTPADNQTVRNVFVIAPDKTLKLILTYPMTTGRNFDEILRVIDSLQLTAKHKVATPANWKQGEDVIITAAVSDDEAKAKYPEGWKTPKPYIRVVGQPK
jgi:hypothetical protein